MDISRSGPDKILFWLGGLGFYWFMLTGFWGRDGHAIALVLLALYFVYWLKPNWRVVGASSLVWLVLVFSAWVAVRALTGYLVAPDSVEWQIEHGWDFLAIGGLFAIFLLPWLIGENAETRLNWAFALVVISLFVQVFLQLFVHDSGVALEGILSSRPGFQMGPNTFGLLCGILLLGVVALASGRLRRIYASGQRGRLFAGGALVFLIVGLLVFGLVISQSRASWLGTLVALPMVVGSIVWANVDLWKRGGKRVALTLLGLVLIGVGGVVYSQWGIVEGRLFQQHEDVAKVIESGFKPEKDEGGSVQGRLHLWRAGIAGILDRPFSGWSPAGIRWVIDERVPVSIPHNFHNVPIQIGVALGAFGLLLFFAMVWVSLREVVNATRAGRLPVEWGLFWVGALVLLGIESVFDFPMYDIEYQFLVLYLGALAMAAQLERLQQNVARSEVSG